MVGRGKGVVGVIVLWVGMMLGVFLPGIGGAIPQKINYQGYLTNPSGVPVNGTLQMVFSIWDVPSGGTSALWTETQNIPVINGIYNVVLGDVTQIPLPFNVPYYLGIKVGSDPEMTPRKALTSVGYAFRAMTADVVGAHSHSGADITSEMIDNARYSAYSDLGAEGYLGNAKDADLLTRIQADGRYVNEGQTNSITSAMIVDLSVGTSGLADSSVTKSKLSTTGGGTAGQVLGTADGTSLSWLSPGAGGGWVDDGATVRLTTAADNVGIGTPTPSSKLELMTNEPLITLNTTGSVAGFRMQQNGSNRWQFAWNSGSQYLYFYDFSSPGTKMVIQDGTGNVGIGNAAPQQKLDVNGQIRAKTGYGDSIQLGSGDTEANDVEIRILAPLERNWITLWNEQEWTRAGLITGNIKIYGAGNGLEFPDGTKVASYKGFPRPNFDSGWNDISPGGSFTLGHGVGGDVNSYFIDLQFKYPDTTGIHNIGIGGYDYYYAGEYSRYGAYYHEVTPTTITVYRHSDDYLVYQFRVRIWKYE